jgi:hypothetical protein
MVDSHEVQGFSAAGSARVKVRTTTVQLLAVHARVLAGGTTLVDLMKLRVENESSVGGHQSPTVRCDDSRRT